MKVGGLIPGELPGSTWVAYNNFRRRLLLKGGGCTSMAVCNRRFSAPVPRKRRVCFLAFLISFHRPSGFFSVLGGGASLGGLVTKKKVGRVWSKNSCSKPPVPV